MIDRVDDRSAGRVMQGAAAGGVIVALVGAIVGWNLVGRVDAAAGETLALTGQALVTIEETVAVADDVVASTVVALESVELALAELVATTEAAQPLLESLAELGTEVAPNLESATDTLRSLAEVGGVIDRVLVTVSAFPGTPAYNPSTPLSEQFDRLADDIEPVADTLREVSDQLGPTVDNTAQVQARLATLEAAVRDVRQDLARSDELLSEYSETARGARVVADRTRSGLAGDVTAARLLVVAASIIFAVGQLVPYWYGRELVARAMPRGQTEPEARPEARPEPLPVDERSDA
jgi:ABC-type transporter Mla subunit MlaD